MARGPARRRQVGTTRPRKSGPQSPRSRRTPPYLLVVGEPHRTGRVCETLEALPVPIRQRADITTVEQELDAAVLGVVLVPPLRGALTVHVVGMIRSHPVAMHLPILVVNHEEVSATGTARLYRRGATAVVAWPSEATLLPILLGESLDVPLARGDAAEADKALRRAIHLRLRMLGKETKGLRISVRHGAVAIRGTTDRLWNKRSLEDCVAALPGVTAVNSRGLTVRASGRSDQEVERSVRTLLKGASSIEEETLAISVHDGHVVLVGTVLNRDEWRHVLELLSMVEGVRAVTNQTQPSGRLKQRLRGRAQRLQKALEELLPDARGIAVAVIGDVVVLRGRARILAARREAERIVMRDDSVARVVNKVEVDAPGVPEKTRLAVETTQAKR